MPNIALKDGQVSAYGFLCGYRQHAVPERIVGDRLRQPHVCLERDGEYILEVFDGKDFKYEWFTADELKAARRLFKSEAKRLGLKLKRTVNND